MLLDSTRRYLLQTKDSCELFIPHSRPAVEIPSNSNEEWVDASVPLAAPPVGSITFPTYVDSTMLSAYRSCPRRFFYEFCRNLHAKRRNVHFNAGGAYASAMEIARRSFYEQGLGSDLSIELGFLALTTAYGDYVPPEGEYKTWERTAAAYLSYFKEWPLDTDHLRPHVFYGRPMIEYSFAHPFPGTTHPETGDPLLLAGRCDMIVEWQGMGNKLFIYDDKTTKAFAHNWARQWHLRGQFSGYVWAARENGINVDGAVIRGAAIQKTQIKHLDSVTYRHDWEIDRWLRATVGTINRMCEDWQRYTRYGVDAFMQDFDSACTNYGGCGFFEACDHKDPEPFLEMDFEFRVWNPVAVTD